MIKIFFTLFSFFVSITVFCQKDFDLLIKVVDTEKQAIPFAIIEFKETNKNFYTDMYGNLVLSNLQANDYHVSIKAMGYFDQNILLVIKDKPVNLEIVLQRESIELDEITIMSKTNEDQTDKSIITKSALEFIQPTSITDAMILLPGSIFSEPSLNQFNGLSFRQVGNNSNSMLGVTVMSDGVSMNNDGNRTQLFGLTAGTNPSYAREGNLRFNAGLDMRTISTDHIESIEVTRGISSARIGNLSGAQVSINSKQGLTPLETRVKIDPNVQMIYAGKGFKISDKLGVLHLGADILQSTPDVREQLTKFTRLSIQANHDVQFSVLGKPVHFNSKFNYTRTVDNFKSDQYMDNGDEIYKTYYDRIGATFIASSNLEMRLMDKLEAIFHVDYTKDVLSRTFMVFSDSGINLSNSLEEGEHEAIFLPSKYMTSYSVENKPFNFNFQINSSKSTKFSDQISQTINYGAQLNSLKNYGDGVVVDINRPPFPGDNSFIRPRPNHVIPTLINSAYYLESVLKLKKENKKLVLTTGLRGTNLLNLPKEYFLHNRMILEPRLQAAFSLDYYLGNKKAETSIRLGYGEQNKMPTLDYLYPDKLYKDVEVLNWYPENEDDRLLITRTFIHDMANEHIRPQRNTKLELGIDFSYSGLDFSITGFSEKSTTGFSYNYSYFPVIYDYYKEPITPISGQPSQSDFIKEEKFQFLSLPTVINNEILDKKGIEYRLVFPKIKSLFTTIEVNGAYYKTTYSNDQPKYYYPNSLINNERYPYVGIYENNREDFYSRFNTNVWINTQIPRLKMIFSTMIQALWFTTDQRGKSESFLPSAIVDKFGNVQMIDYTSEVLENPLLSHLDLRVNDTNFGMTKSKPSFLVNFKGTKEIKNFGKISFFVNSLISINSKYKNMYNVNSKLWNTPFYGAEVTIKL